MKKALTAVGIAMASALTVVAVALAWPNEVTGDVTGEPVCNTQTGLLVGEFEVTWKVVEPIVVDPGFVLKSVVPSSPNVVTYGQDKAGQQVTGTFTLTQEKTILYDEDVFKYVGPFQGDYIKWFGSFKYVGHPWGDYIKEHSKGDVRRVITQSADFSETITLPSLAGCKKDDVFAATVVCDEANSEYDVSGTINGNAASVNPATIAGNFAGVTEITVSNGEQSSGKVNVETAGTCVKRIPPPPPCVPKNPDGSLGGKDGKPGNDDCAADPQPPVDPPVTPEPPVVPPVEPPVTPPVTPEPPVTEQPEAPVAEPTTPPVSEPAPQEPVAKPTTKPQAPPETS